MIRSLRTKLTVYGLLSLLLVFAGLGLYLAIDSRHYLLQLTAEDMRDQTVLIGQQYETLLARRVSDDSLRSFTAGQAAVLGRRITIVAKTGMVLFDSDVSAADLPGLDNHLARPEIIQASADGWGYAARYSRTLKQDLIYLAVPLHVRGEMWGYCRLAWPWRRFMEYQRRLMMGFTAALLISMLLLALMTSLVWRPAARVIKRIGTVSQSIAAGEFSARAPVNEGPLETVVIAQSLNAMAESWERAALQLHEKTTQLESILESMREGVVVVGADGRIGLINPAAAAMLDTTAGQAAGKLVLELIRLPQLDQLVTGQADVAEVEIGGRTLLVHSSTLSGPVAGRVLVLLDVTDLKRLEGLRRDFVANVSHELKTPLSAVIGFTEALRDGAQDVPTERDDFLGRIHRQASRMAKIVNDLLDISGLETGNIRLNRQPVKVRQLIDQAMDAVGQQIRSRGMRVAVPSDPALELMINVDEERMTTALVNLLDNAVKFAPEKSTITVAAAASPGSVKLSVSDEGPGIPPEHLPRLFERFYRVDKSRSRDLGGTGLGLSIVKHVAETHGGSVGVTSDVGNGSTFWISLPVSP
ncbi:MAG TPA: ATP-binding protein [Candidatus Edwardsbacteria bacterium]|nr:ATP-binding protein [Candidatus Edwardsbacteria bacterium]